jgi:glycerate dehydrogenase
MKIVITDGYTLNPGDLSWDQFHSLGTVQYYDRTDRSELVQRVKDADVIVTNKTPLNSETINACSHLKLIVVTATGYNIVDVSAAKSRNVIVSNVPEYGTHSVAQHAIALMLELSNCVGKNSASVHHGEWSASNDWCYTKSPLIELKDKTLGIVGMGRIGNQTASVAQALGMNIVFHRGKTQINNARQLEMHDLFRESDFISLHCPLRPDNEKFVSDSLLGIMKRTAYLINTSRGQLIDEHALANTLKKGRIGGAALDVLSVEPPAENPLIGLPNCIITPHTAWLSREARSRILQTSFENIRLAFAGTPQNVVK